MFPLGGETQARLSPFLTPQKRIAPPKYSLLRRHNRVIQVLHKCLECAVFNSSF
jgi:hypothetical protein